MVIRQYMMKCSLCLPILILIGRWIPISIRLMEEYEAETSRLWDRHPVFFLPGMYFGGILAEVKRPEFPAEEQETRRTWERQEQPPADSTLENPEECYLCGNHNRSLMSMFREGMTWEVICVNDWYVMDLQIRNLTEWARGSGWTVGAEGPAASRQTGIRNGISEVMVEYGENRSLT